MRLVFCEDEERIRKLIGAMLDTTPYEVHLASDGLEGLELIERVRPDLIFIDISMPGCDGFELAAMLQERPELEKIPFVFLTAFAQRSEKDEAFKHGASGYLTKPFNLSELLATIEKFASPQTDAVPKVIEKGSLKRSLQ